MVREKLVKGQCSFAVYSCLNVVDTILTIVIKQGLNWWGYSRAKWFDEVEKE